MHIFQDDPLVALGHHLSARMLVKRAVEVWIPLVTNRVQVSGVQGVRQVILHLQLREIKDQILHQSRSLSSTSTRYGTIKNTSSHNATASEPHTIGLDPAPYVGVNNVLLGI